MVKVPFVVFSLALVLSIQFVVRQDEKALDEAASPGAEDVLLSSEVAKLLENFKSFAGDDSQSVDRPTSSFADEIATSSESKVKVATESVRPPSGLVDEIAASPEFEVEVATESIGGRKRKMA
ncbi:hypothetical protein ES319_D01G014000v1 [Gossypium barbadense]|uniref:Uncharacterized protein n=2 Tax=Gossypium TaxID=3633 RepID=A0A5J5SIV7_GOSBA|nr:hypothetical protein ES319_D01G014000v1 [Gossypium barbadense]PPD97953.1 hypothetical protein GOBAR_DD05026 [Gossypium barbadense]TYG81563.1 hypothetical protein ES288_D01G015200v1 [Gossypium darwinii]